MPMNTIVSIGARTPIDITNKDKQPENINAIVINIM